TLKWVRENEAKVRFVTNNPRFSREFYQEKLINLGIEAELDEVVTSSQVTASYLQKNNHYGKVFVIGEEQLLGDLRKKGVEVVEDDTADTLLVSFDTKLHYEKLMIAYRLLNKGAKFITTNPDFVCPTPEGGLIDSGAIIAMLESATTRKIEKVIGKPSKILGELLLEELDVLPNECVVVGDRLNTDVRLGKQSDMLAIWIRAFNEEIPENTTFLPDHIVKSISEIPYIFKKEVENII